MADHFTKLVKNLFVFVVDILVFSVFMYHTNEPTLIQAPRLYHMMMVMTSADIRSPQQAEVHTGIHYIHYSVPDLEWNFLSSSFYNFFQTCKNTNIK